MTAEILNIKAQNREEVAQFNSKAMLTDAAQEALSYKNLVNKRAHEERMAKTRSMQGVVKSSKAVIAGKNGDDLLNFFKEANDISS